MPFVGVIGPAARSHVANGAVEIDDAISDIVIASSVPGHSAWRALELGAIVRMNEFRKRLGGPVEFLLRPAEERIHVIVPGDAPGQEVPIPGAGLRSFQGEAQTFLARAERGVAFPDAW